MKSMKNVFIYLMAFFMATMLGASSCKKKVEPTRDFECRVNGRYYTYESGPNSLQCDMLGDTVLLIGGSSNGEGVSLLRRDLTGLKIGSYDIKTPGVPTSASYSNQPYEENVYRTDSIHIGKLIITEFDKVNKIIAGTFYFSAYCKKYDSAVSITDGSFRLKYLKY